MEVLFSDAFVKSLEKHSAIKKAVKKKVDMIIESPIALGEPLKGNFRGYYSCPVRKNLLIIYLYCKICRKKGDDEIVFCNDCAKCPDNTIKFIALGPHDSHLVGQGKSRPTCLSFEEDVGPSPPGNTSRRSPCALGR